MFTNNWFEITAKQNFEKYVKPLATLPNLNFLEVGCYEGKASVWLLENTKAELTAIDTFKGSKEHDTQFEQTMLARFNDNISSHKDRVITLEGTSRDRLKEIAPNSFNFIYIDGSHQASDVLEDAVLAFPLLRESGIMIFDDYTWRGGKTQYELPAMGIDAFLFVYANQVEILEKNSQVIIKRPMIMSQ